MTPDPTLPAPDRGPFSAAERELEAVERKEAMQTRKRVRAVQGRDHRDEPNPRTWHIVAEADERDLLATFVNDDAQAQASTFVEAWNATAPSVHADPDEWAHLPRLPDSILPFANMFCGCATTENTWGAVLAELDRLERKEYLEDDGLAQALCDHVGLSEHGTAIRGGWLTDKGVEALAFLRKWGIDWEDKAHFVASDGVHYGDTSL